jgi:uncharacterized repeat protein (TIGR01451 family)
MLARICVSVCLGASILPIPYTEGGYVKKMLARLCASILALLTRGRKLRLQIRQFRVYLLAIRTYRGAIAHMRHWGRCLSWLVTAVLLTSAAGCFGLSQNPSYFPYYVPFGDVVRTHAKPIGHGYYANFDPYAVELALEPQVMTSQVGSQVVVLATVRDEKGTPRRNRRIDWKVSGGNLIEVDESGILNGRGGVEGNTAFSFTNYGEHRLSRGNANKADDIMIRPGQSWCVVSSPVEGDTHISAIVPGIYNWDKRMKTTVVRWVDVSWEFPARAIAKFGTEHEFATKIVRFTDRLPLAKYRVRYKILDGPPAILLPSRAQEEVAISDLSGIAKVRIAQLSPASGVNRVSVEIIRPPDPSTPSGAGVPIITGETSVEWIAPDVKFSHVGPAAAGLGQEMVYTTTAKNDGRVESQWVQIALPIPDGAEFVASNPPATAEGGQLVFPFGVLAVGQTHTVQATFRAKRPGVIKSIALMRTAENQNDQKEVNTTITEPQLKAEILGPKTSGVDAPITFVIRLSNPGTGPLDDITMLAQFDKGFEFDKGSTDPLKSTVRGLAPGESRDEPLILTPRRVGPLGLRVTVTSGVLKAEANHVVQIQQPKISLRVAGPAKRFVGRPVEWKIAVKNESDTDQPGVVVRDRLPAQVRFTSASRNGQHVSGEVTWNLGVLRPGEEVVLDLTAEAVTPVVDAVKTTFAVGDGNVRAEQATRITLEGIAALKLEMNGLTNPVEVGKNAVYRMTLTNTGSAPAKNIDVKATASDLLKPLMATGPTKEMIAGKFITFGKIDTLQPGAKLIFQFECQAVKEGDARFRVEYSSDLNPAPIFEEEPTRIVAPLSAPVPAPVPPLPPPGGGVPKALPPG